MSWTDKAHKKIKAEKMAMEIMNSPRYREARKQDMQEATMNALATFTFIGLVYLEMNFRCKTKGFEKFIEFVKGTVIDFKEDEKWIEDSNEYYKETYGLDVLKRLGLEKKEKVNNMGKVDHKPTQNERIVNYMHVHGSITQFEALQELGIMRLASRISDLRRMGYPIASKMVTVKNRFDEECKVKRYRFEDETEIR